jgi:hypothetical protein
MNPTVVLSSHLEVKEVKEVKEAKAEVPHLHHARNAIDTMNRTTRMNTMLQDLICSAKDRRLRTPRLSPGKLTACGQCLIDTTGVEAPMMLILVVLETWIRIVLISSPALPYRLPVLEAGAQEGHRVDKGTRTRMT